MNFFFFHFLLIIQWKWARKLFPPLIKDQTETHWNNNAPFLCGYTLNHACRVSSINSYLRIRVSALLRKGSRGVVSVSRVFWFPFRARVCLRLFLEALSLLLALHLPADAVSRHRPVEDEARSDLITTWPFSAPQPWRTGVNVAPTLTHRQKPSPAALHLFIKPRSASPLLLSPLLSVLQDWRNYFCLCFFTPSDGFRCE